MLGTIAGGTRLSTNQIRSQAFAQQRRSQRILLSVPILVSGQHPNGSAFSERTKTLVVNAHGALIQLRVPVLTGEGMRIKNLATNEELACTVVDINPGSTEIPEIGIAFAKPCPISGEFPSHRKIGRRAAQTQSELRPLSHRPNQ
jgi:hypothetical protein